MYYINDALFIGVVALMLITRWYGFLHEFLIYSRFFKNPQKSHFPYFCGPSSLILLYFWPEIRMNFDLNLVLILTGSNFDRLEFWPLLDISFPTPVSHKRTQKMKKQGAQNIIFRPENSFLNLRTLSKKPFAEICARGRKNRLWKFAKMEKSWKIPKNGEACYFYNY